MTYIVHFYYRDRNREKLDTGKVKKKEKTIDREDSFEGGFEKKPKSKLKSPMVGRRAPASPMLGRTPKLGRAAPSPMLSRAKSPMPTPKLPTKFGADDTRYV